MESKYKIIFNSTDGVHLPCDYFVYHLREKRKTGVRQLVLFLFFSLSLKQYNSNRNMKVPVNNVDA